MFEFLRNKVGDLPADMYLRGYGGFDNFALDCCRRYKQTHPDIVPVFITPYLHTEYHCSRLEFSGSRYDAVIYPDIENRPQRFAVYYRNRYMVEKADLVVAYINHAWGGAYSAYKYAKSRGKEILNLADFD